MNYYNLFAFAAVWIAIFVVWLRVDIRARWTALAFVTVPGLGLLCFWAVYRKGWPELWAGLGLALGLTLLWWLIWGRHLPPADSRNITVWKPEPSPPPEPTVPKPRPTRSGIRPRRPRPGPSRSRNPSPPGR